MTAETIEPSTSPKSAPMDPSLLFSPSVKVKEVSTSKASRSGVPVKITTAPDRQSVPVASTAWPTQTRKEQEAAKLKKLQSQKIAVGRKALSPTSASSVSKSRSQPLDPTRKGTGTSVTVVTRTVKVPRPPAPKPKLPSPDSVEPVSSTKAKTKRGNSAAPKKRSVSAQPVPGRSGKHADRSSGSPLATGSRDHNDLPAPTSLKTTKAAAAAATKATTKAPKQARKGKAQ